MLCRELKSGDLIATSFLDPINLQPQVRIELVFLSELGPGERLWRIKTLRLNSGGQGSYIYLLDKELHHLNTGVLRDGKMILRPYLTSSWESLKVYEVA